MISRGQIANVQNIVPIPHGDQIDLSGEFGNAFHLVNDSLESHFITGKAGTGKSTLLRHYANESQRRIALLAPTGIAAVNIQGQTIHSFFRFPPEPITSEHIHESRFKELYRALDTIVIDEVSMVRADLMDGIDQVLRLNRGRPGDPFGGVQMLFFGDVFQLQPVVASDEEAKYFSSYYRSPYFFDAKVFDEARFKIIDLQKVFRQKDLGFIGLLDAIRMNRAGDTQLRAINSRHRPNLSDDDSQSRITLASTNDMVAQVNNHHLSRLTSQQFSYLGRIEGKFPRKSLPTEMELRLKSGAQVMFVRNDMAHRWVNGTIGKIVELAEDHIAVQVEEGGGVFTFDVPVATWEVRKHPLDNANHSIRTEVVGSFTQYPLKLAWAVTIHKSQGLTFDDVVVDLGAGAFAHGQTYVALSRCTSFEGLILKTKVRRKDIIVDYAVSDFYRSRIRGATFQVTSRWK